VIVIVLYNESAVIIIVILRMRIPAGSVILGALDIPAYLRRYDLSVFD
jgi:hypothetical protein